MVKIRHYRAVGPVTAEPALALFQKQWQLYRKVVDYNYLFHRESYSCPCACQRFSRDDLQGHALGREAGFGQVR